MSDPAKPAMVDKVSSYASGRSSRRQVHVSLWRRYLLQGASAAFCSGAASIGQWRWRIPSNSASRVTRCGITSTRNCSRPFISRIARASGQRALIVMCLTSGSTKCGERSRLRTSFFTNPGTVNTPEKFEKHRLELAQHVWATMKHDFHECRNCHSATRWTRTSKKKRRQKRWKQDLRRAELVLSATRVLHTSYQRCPMMMRNLPRNRS